jgi:hypothetical protein
MEKLNASCIQDNSFVGDISMQKSMYSAKGSQTPRLARNKKISISQVSHISDNISHISKTTNKSKLSKFKSELKLGT